MFRLLRAAEKQVLGQSSITVERLASVEQLLVVTSSYDQGMHADITVVTLHDPLPQPFYTPFLLYHCLWLRSTAVLQSFGRFQRTRSRHDNHTERSDHDRVASPRHVISRRTSAAASQIVVRPGKSSQITCQLSRGGLGIRERLPSGRRHFRC
jgi:hypothetical protein